MPELADKDLSRLEELLDAKSRLERGALRCYRPLPKQAEFLRSKASEVILRGGNRSGKTVTAACAFAALALNQPIYDQAGKPIKLYRAKEREKQPMLMWAIGLDQRHLGQTIHRVLFEPGLFMIIRDKITGQWRAWHPQDPEDQARSGEARAAEPLIPQSEIDGMNWIAYGQKILESVYLKNGTKLCFYASTGMAKQGDAVDIIWIDEDVEHSRHIGEWQARLSDRKGRLLWSAFPHSKNMALIHMSERAAEQADRKRPDIQEFVLRYIDNPWIDDDEKRKRIEGWSFEEGRARNLGEFTFDTVLMYDWSASIQGIPNEQAEKCPINAYYAKHQAIPPDWTRYLVLDPGHSTTAVLFAAVPPPQGSGAIDWGDVVVIEDEIYLKKATCYDTAKKVYEKHGHRTFEAFIIDMHAGRQTPMGGAITVRQQYSAAFEQLGLRCVKTGCNFAWGSDNTEARRGILRTWMQPRSNYTHSGSRLRVVLDKTPNLQREFKSYRKRVTADNFTEDEPAKSPHDAIDCLEYLAAFNPRWVRPSEAIGVSRSARLMQAIDKMFAPKQPDMGMYFGPGS